MYGVSMQNPEFPADVWENIMLLWCFYSVSIVFLWCFGGFQGVLIAPCFSIKPTATTYHDGAVSVKARSKHLEFSAMNTRPLSAFLWHASRAIISVHATSNLLFARQSLYATTLTCQYAANSTSGSAVVIPIRQRHAESAQPASPGMTA